jgi:hypothetical protein
LDEQIDRIFELSRDTLKNYIKKAGSSGHPQSAPNLASKAAFQLGSGDEDDGEAEDRKAYRRSQGIGRAVDRLEEEGTDWAEYERRVAELERKGLTRSDAQGVVDAEMMQTKQVNELNKDTLGSYVKKASSDRAIRNFDQGFDTGKSFDQREPDFDADNARRDDSRRKGIGRAVNRLTREEYQELSELSPDTLKNYIKKAGMSAVNKGAEIGQKQAAADEVDRYTNRHFPKGTDQYGQRDAMRKAVGADYDDINKTRSKAQKRVTGIGRAADRLGEADTPNTEKAVEIYRQIMNKLSNRKDLKAQYGQQLYTAANSAARELAHTGMKPGDDPVDYTLGLLSSGMGRASLRMSEASDTVEKDAEGKVKSWSHSGDWKKIPKSHGKAKDPRGEVTNLAGRELQKAKNLKESGMGDVDLTLQEIARGNIDIYDIYVNPKTAVEMFVQEQLHDKAEEISRERGIDLDGDIDKILQIIHADLVDEYGVDESSGGGNFLESSGDRTALTGQYGHSGKMSAVEDTDADMMERIKFLAGLTK